MEASEEIRRVVDRWLVTARDGDAEGYMARFSQHPGALAIGTDDQEWLQGTALRVFERQLEELGGFPLEWSEIEAWEEGSVGWAASHMRFRSLDGGAGHSPARFTCVLRLERGDWKIVQVHWSFGVPNLDAMGVELPTSLEQLEQTIRQERPDLSMTSAADGTVTLVFTDIVDSTVLTVRLGDRAWMGIVHRHRDVIRSAVDAHGGRLVETEGDGSLLAFTSARGAVACARDIQTAIDAAFGDTSPPIRLRIGIHTGDAIHDADRFFGSTVNYAARVASHSLGGEILVSSIVHDLVGESAFEFVDNREVELKGLEGIHRLFAVAVP